MKFDELKQLLKADRTFRRFDESVPVPEETLRELVDLTRYCASGRNAQPLKYRLVVNSEEREKVYPLLKWAGYFQDWDGPEKGERPTAYLVQCLDTTYGANCLCDDGLQLQAITLGAAARGLGCCIIKSFNVPGIARDLGLTENLQPRYVVALGQPKEKVVLEDMDGTPDADFKYWRDAEGVHHVPKRPLSELIV